MASFKEPPFSEAKMEGIHQRQANRMRTASPSMLAKQTEQYLITIQREDRKNGNTRNMNIWNWLNKNSNYLKVKIPNDKVGYKKPVSTDTEQEQRETERMLTRGANG